MPRQPDASYQPSIDIDIDKSYIAKLNLLEELPSKFTDRHKDAKTLVHHFSIHDVDTGVAVIDDASGDMHDQWHFTPDSTFANPTTGVIAKARVVANALMGKTLSDDEVKSMIARGWDKALVGKAALVDFDWATDSNGNERLRIIRWRPYKKPSPAAVDSVSSTPTDEAETVEQKRARLQTELEALTG